MLAISSNIPIFHFGIFQFGIYHTNVCQSRLVINMDKTIYSAGHKALVKKLIEARKERNLQQKDVAKLLSRTQSYISKIEAGQRRIDLIQLKEFAKIYKKNLDFFIK
jgi:DNA-binding XRE family transcriptional regulator